MTLRCVPARWFVLPLLVMLIVPQGLFAQQDKTAAPKQPPTKPSASQVRTPGSVRLESLS